MSNKTIQLELRPNSDSLLNCYSSPIQFPAPQYLHPNKALVLVVPYCCICYLLELNVFLRPLYYRTQLPMLLERFAAFFPSTNCFVVCLLTIVIFKTHADDENGKGWVRSALWTIVTSFQLVLIWSRIADLSSLYRNMTLSVA